MRQGRDYEVVNEWWRANQERLVRVARDGCIDSNPMIAFAAKRVRELFAEAHRQAEALGLTIRSTYRRNGVEVPAPELPEPGIVVTRDDLRGLLATLGIVVTVRWKPSPTHPRRAEVLGVAICVDADASSEVVEVTDFCTDGQ